MTNKFFLQKHDDPESFSSLGQFLSCGTCISKLWANRAKMATIEPYLFFLPKHTSISVPLIVSDISTLQTPGQPRNLYCTENKTVQRTVHCFVHWTVHCTIHSTVSILGREEGYTVKYTPLPEGVPKGEARGNS